jgi:hypothetical protein
MTTTDVQPYRPLSNSEIQTFKECRRRWYFESYLGIRPRYYIKDIAGPAHLGTRVHDALEAYYSPEFPDCVDADGCLAVFDAKTAEEAEKVLGTEAEVAWRKDVSLGRIMLEGYFQYLEESGVDAYFTVLYAERQANVPLLFDGEQVMHIAPDPEKLPVRSPCRAPAGTELPVHLVAKLDLTVLDHVSERPLFVDHKTAATIGEHAKTADIDEQFPFYILIEMMEAKLRGENPETATMGGTYNILRKVKRSPKATPPFYARHAVHYSTEQVRGFWEQMTGAVRDMMEVERRLNAGESPTHVAYPNVTRDCEWKCAFRSLCPMVGDSRSDAKGMMRNEFVATDNYERYPEISFPQPKPTEEGVKALLDLDFPDNPMDFTP